MESPDVARAIRATTSIAASLDLPVTEAVVLQNSNKLALRLTPCDVFARVAHVGEEVAQFEIDIAGLLAQIGSPVSALEPRVDPQVYICDGFAVTLWTYYPPMTPGLSPLNFAEALAQLHVGMGKIEVESPRFSDRVADALAIVESTARSPELSDDDRQFLGGRLRDLQEAIDQSGAAEQLLHGEPHPGNVLNTTHGALFIDFETCCRGPVEFDLAHVPPAVCEEYQNVDKELLDDCRQLVLAMVAAWRWDTDDQFPNGRRFGEELLRSLRDGPPWPTLDTMVARVEGP